MNKNLLKLMVACGTVCFLELLASSPAQHLKKQKQKNGANVWHALR